MKMPWAWVLWLVGTGKLLHELRHVLPLGSRGSGIRCATYCSNACELPRRFRLQGAEGELHHARAGRQGDGEAFARCALLSTHGTYVAQIRRVSRCAVVHLARSGVAVDDEARHTLQDGMAQHNKMLANTVTCLAV